jgi:hypothetical protein
MKKIAETSRVGVLAGVVVVSLAASAATIGCSSTSHDDCHETHSCPDQVGGDSQGGSGSHGGSQSPGPGVDGGGGGTAGNDGGNGGAGGEPTAPSAGAGGEAKSCTEDAECSNGDASDGEEVCTKGECLAGNAPPTIISITPEDGTEDVEPDAPITVVFSEPLDPTTVTDSLKLFDGDTEVPGTVQLEDGAEEVTFTPDTPLDLWTDYRLEIAADVADTEGATLLDGASSTFQVRDGAWSVKVLAHGDSIVMPSSLPISASGAILASWAVQQGEQCSAAGRWVLRGQTEAKESFGSLSTIGTCASVTASIAPDGDAVVAWLPSRSVSLQAFTQGAWMAKERVEPDYYSTDVEVFAHADQRMSLLYLRASKGGPYWTAATGASTTAGDETYAEFPFQTGRPRAAFDSDGRGLMVWSVQGYAVSLGFTAYDADGGTWAASEVVPGTDVADSPSDERRGDPGVAMGPAGEAMIVWVNEAPAAVQLMSSRFVPSSGWQAKPSVVSGKLLVESVNDSTEPPALIFDGETYVAAWAAKTGSTHTIYTARYLMADKRWDVYEPHTSAAGPSASAMPRLGVDSHRNLLLVWTLAGDPATLAYQRYRADTGTWGEAQQIPDVAHFEASVPFGVSGNGLAGLMFRDYSGATLGLVLAQFF